MHASTYGAVANLREPTKHQETKQATGTGFLLLTIANTVHAHKAPRTLYILSRVSVLPQACRLGVCNLPELHLELDLTHL